MQKQKGVTLSGFMLWSIVVIVALLLGFKVGPSYLEYYAIVSQFKVIVNDPSVNTGVRREVEGSFVRRAVMENIRSIGPADLQIVKDGDRVVISAEYSVKVPLFGNMSACMNFYPRSGK